MKVKKEKKEWTPDFCPCCGQTWDTKPKPKGNWGNGENLDKIKFPCFCSFEWDYGKRLLGQINHCRIGTVPYRLSNITEQKKYNICRQSGSLRELIESHNIHILKGKIIIYEG